jgi:hypothetical protein
MMSTPNPAPRHRSSHRFVARSSWNRRAIVAIALLASAGVAGAQPAGGGHHRRGHKPPDPPPAPDPTVELSARLDAAEAARKAADDRLAAAEKALADQAAAVAAARDAAAAQATKLDLLGKQLAAEQAVRAAAAADHDKAAAAAAAHPPIGSRWRGIGVAGFAQIDFAHRQSSVDEIDTGGNPLNQDRFNLRRARVRVSADYGRVFGDVELDGNTNSGPQAKVVGAEVSYSPFDRAPGGASPLAATAGLFKIPFGQEVLESDADRLFLERSTIERALFPGEYDVGARLAGSWRFVRYAVAVQNGEPVGEKAFPGRDPNAAKDITGHVGVDTHVGDVHVVAGFSALTGRGFSRGTPATKDTLVWRDINEDGAVELNEIQVIPGQAAIPSADFDRFAVGGDLRLGYDVPSLGLLELRGELIVATNLDRGVVPADPVAATRDLRETGYYVQAVQELPRHLVAGARFDHYDADADATDQQAGVVVPKTNTFSTLAVDLGVQFEHARLVLEYDLNRNHLGRDDTGRPTNLQDDAVLARAQVMF